MSPTIALHCLWPILCSPLQALYVAGKQIRSYINPKIKSVFHQHYKQTDANMDLPFHMYSAPSQANFRIDFHACRNFLMGRQG